MKTLITPLRLMVVAWLVLGWALPGLAAAGPTAQVQQPTIHIHNLLGPAQFTDPNGLDALRVTLDFTLLNNVGEVMPGIAIGSATLDLEDGSRNPAPITDITAPWTVGLLVDSSRTLFLSSANTAFKAARGDIIDAVGLLPDGSTVGVLTFDAKTAILEDFTPDKTKVQTALLQRWKPVNNAVSCLYAGAMQALTEIAPKPGRKALIILTASANTCGDLPQAVIEAANQNNVQIYGVAIRGFAAVPGELQLLAEGTGGLVDTRNANDVNFSFLNITNALNLQRRATATFYPLIGPHEATLSLVLPDNSTIHSLPRAIVAERNFEAPPTLSIQGEVLFKKENLQVNLALTSPALVDHLEATVIDVITARAVIENFVIPRAQGQIEIPVGKLPDGQKFLLQLAMINADQAVLPPVVEKEFTVQPVVPVLVITNVEVPAAEAEDGAFVVTLQRENLDEVAKYRVALVPNGTTLPVAGTVNIVPLALTVSVPVVDKLPSGLYQVMVEPLALDDTVLLPAILTPQFSYTAPDPRAIFFRNLRSNTGAIAGISVATALGCVGLVVVIFFAVSAARPRQGRLPKTVDLALPDVKRRAPAPVLDSASLRAPSDPPRPARPSAPRRPAERPPAQRPPADRSRSAPPPEAEPPALRTQHDASAEPVPAPAAAAGPAMPKACLTSHTPPELRLTGRISSTPFTIGRAAGNDMVVQVDNRVGVSSKHASIIYDKGRFFIIDQKSTYGTTLNDQRLAPNTPTPLEEGALIGLGPKIKVKFSLQDCK